MKSLLQYKIQRIEELERQIEQLESALDKEKIKYHEKMEQERNQWSKSIEFLKEQVSLKDKRIDMLLDAVYTKDSQFKVLLEQILSCPCRKRQEETEGKIPTNLMDSIK
jgi:hypothetical protein